MKIFSSFLEYIGLLPAERMSEFRVEFAGFFDGVACMAVDTDGVAALHESGKFFQKIPVGFGVDFELKDGVVDAKTVLAQQLLHLFAPLVVGNIVGDEEVHGSISFFIQYRTKEERFLVRMRSPQFIVGPGISSETEVPAPRNLGSKKPRLQDSREVFIDLINYIV